MVDNIYVIIFDKVSLYDKCFFSKEIAIKFLESEGYKHYYEDIYCTDKKSAQIKTLKTW